MTCFKYTFIFPEVKHSLLKKESLSIVSLHGNDGTRDHTRPVNSTHRWTVNSQQLLSSGPEAWH